MEYHELSDREKNELCKGWIKANWKECGIDTNGLYNYEQLTTACMDHYEDQRRRLIFGFVQQLAFELQDDGFLDEDGEVLQ